MEYTQVEIGSIDPDGSLGGISIRQLSGSRDEGIQAKNELIEGFGDLESGGSKGLEP